MFTKAEIEKLSIEQREVLAKFEFSDAQRRLKLLKQARGCHGGWLRNFLFNNVIVWTFWLAVVGGGFLVAHLDPTKRLPAICILCGLALANLLIGIHTARLNGRLDALLELLDFDRHHQKDNDGSKGKTG